MKIKGFFVQSLMGVILLGMLFASPGWASLPSVQTALADVTVTVGDEFHLSVLLNLDGSDSSGGYVDLVYDPNVLECVEIQNFHIFGGMEVDSCAADSGIFRITSRTASSYDVLMFPSLETYAMVTFRAKQAAASTAVEFADLTTQIFGVGGGNILVERDDSATRHITIEAEAVLPPDPVDDPLPGDGEPAPDNFTPGDEEPTPDDFTPGDGEPAPDDFTPGDDEPAPDDFTPGDEEPVPDDFAPRDEESVPPPAVPVVVPEPSTWLLLILGLGGILFMRRRKN